MIVLLHVLMVGKKNNKHIVQIAAMRIDEKKFSPANEFFRLVRPENASLVNWQQDEYKSCDRKDFLDAEPEERVITDLWQWLNGKDHIYCWDDRTQSALSYIHEKYWNGKVSKTYEANVLRNYVHQYFHISPSASFRVLCAGRNIQIGTAPYSAQRTVRAIRLLLKSLHFNPLSVKPEMFQIGQGDTQPTTPNKQDIGESADDSQPHELLLYSITSHRKTVHRPNCARLRRIPPEKLSSFNTLNEAREKGYHHCKCCSPIKRVFQNDYPSLKHYCEVYNLECTYNDDTIHIASRYDFWRVIYGGHDHELALLHKNTDPVHHHDKNLDIYGFHRQFCDANTLRGMLRYIVRHDQYRDNEKWNKLANAPKKNMVKAKD